MAAEKVLGFRIEVRGTDKQTSEMAKLNAETIRMRKTVELLNKIEKQNGTLTAKQTNQRQLLSTQIKANAYQYNQLNKQVLQNNNVVQKNESFTKKMAKSIVSAGTAMFGIGAAITAVTALIGSAIKTVIDYSKENSKLEAVLKSQFAEMKDNGVSAMKALTDQSKKLGGSTAFTATEVAKLQVEYAKLGFPTTDILNMTEATLNGAAALGSDLAEQAAFTGATLKQYGLDATDATRVNDVMAEAASRSALDFSKLSTALPIVGATANAVGVDLERTTALLGTLADRGIDASTSGTSLRNVFLELSKKGLTYDQAMAKINSSSDKAKTSMELFGKRGATTGLILAETGATIEQLEGQLNDAEGAAKAMADTMLDNLAGDVTIAKSAWEGFILAIEDGEGIFSKASRSITQSFTGLLSSLTLLNTAATPTRDK